jgi:RHS repeat-associated protein
VDAFTFPVTGTYSVVVDPRGQNTGSLTFELDSVPDNTGSTAIGSATTVSIGTAGENATRTFSAVAGQKATLSVSGNTIASGELDVFSPTGSFVDSTFLSGATAFVDAFTFPVTGTYSVVVDPRGQNTGSLTFELDSVPANTGSTAIGSATTVSIGTVGENATRTFTAGAGQKATLTVSGNTIVSGEVDVFSPSGSFVASTFLSGATAFVDTFTFPVTGTYTVVVDPRGQNTGSLTFQLSSVPDNTGSTAIGSATTVSIGTAGENATRTFAAVAGQKATMTVSGNTIVSGEVDVFSPSGSFVASTFLSGATAFVDTFTFPVTGTYTVVVDPRVQNTGSLTFELDAVATLQAALVGPDTTGAPGVDDPTAAIDPADAILLSAPLASPNQASLTINVADLLANDRPGPANESDQTLTVTGIASGPDTHGTATLADRAVTYTPDTGYVGSAVITYTACDNGTTNGQPDPRCADGTLTITVTANQPPTADGLTVVTAEDTATPVTLTASDPDGDPLAYDVTSGPSHGTVTGIAPNLTYTPAPDFSGTDTFTFTANDGYDQSAPATVTITVLEVNDGPTPQPDSVTGAAGHILTIPAVTLLTNDTPGPANESNQTLTVTAVTASPASHGTATLDNGTITYTPDVGYTGAATLTYTVCDNGTTNGQPDPRCADATITVTLNASPAATNQTVSTPHDVSTPIALTATDPENDQLTYTVATNPGHGTLSGTAPALTYTPAPGFIGTDAFTFTASDPYSASAPATVTITVTDTPPPTLIADTATTRAGVPVVIDVLANDTPATGALDRASLTIATAPAHGTATVDTGQVRYTPAPDATADTFTYRVCDTGGGCGTASVTITITANQAPVATADTYDANSGATLSVPAPGVLTNDTDPDGDPLQARLVTGVTNGQLLLRSDGSFTYTPNSFGVDTFTYHAVDPSGGVSADVTVSLLVTGPGGPPLAGNDRYDLQQGTELSVPAPGVLANDASPDPRLTLTVLLEHDAAKGSLLLHPDGSLTYVPNPGFTGLDSFSYTLRDSEGHTSDAANVTLAVAAGGPPTPTVGTTTPPAGAIITGPTHVSASLAPPAGETITNWTVSYRRPGDPTVTSLASGSGPDVNADFDPTLLRDGTYTLSIRAQSSGGGVLVSDTGVSVDGTYKPGHYATTFNDVALNSSNIPISLYRTYDNTNKVQGDFGVGWTLDLASFRIDTNGPLGSGGWTKFTCGSFPFISTCYSSSIPHLVTITWPDGHLERFRFAPDPGSALISNVTTAGFQAEPGTTSTLEAVDNGLALLGDDFYLGNLLFADRIYDPTQFILTDKTGTKYLLDRHAGLLGITDRNGNTVTLGSDGLDSSSGMSMTFVRDADNRITRITAPGGNIDYTYSPMGDLIGVSYPNGTSQTFTYDASHSLLTISGGGQLVRTLQYDSGSRLTAVTDGNGHTTTISSNVPGHQQAFTDATGQLTTVDTYDDRGDLIQQDQTFGTKTVTTTYTYDSIGELLSTTDPLGHVTRQTYDPAGNVLTKTDADSNTTTLSYNGFGQPLTITDSTGVVTTDTYDVAGHLLTTTDPTGAVTKDTYDAGGHLLTTTDPTGRVTTYAYDSNGQLAGVSDPAGHTTARTVDAGTGRVTSVTDPTGAKTTFAYDADGNLTAITDANGHTRTATYDAFDRVTSLTDPAGNADHYTYDGAGNLTLVTDRNGATLTYTYDADSRLVSKTVPGAGTTTYSYDPLGRRLTASNAAAHVTSTYDDGGRELVETTAGVGAPLLPTTTFTYTYDAAGNRTSTVGPGGTTSYTYDAAERIASLTDPAGAGFAYTYDAAGRQTGLTRPNGIADAISYDGAGNLTSMHSTIGASLVNQADYTYDAAGLRSELTTTAGTTSYTYDGANQLTGASYPASTGLSADTFSYDPVGNRTSTASEALGSFTYDSGDRLQDDVTNTFTYDKEGNLLTRVAKAGGATTSYAWTAEHQLIGITYPDGTTATFRYDPIGRRVEIDEGTTVTRYAYDGPNLAAEYDGTNALASTYTQDPTTTNRALEMVRAGQRYFYLADAQRSTTALTSVAGATVATYTYTAFGVPTEAGALANPITYTGQVYDANAKLLLFPLRAYDPNTGRFLSEDPAQGTSDRYPYVDNDPTNLIDPTGAEETAEYTITLRALIGAVACASKIKPSLSPETGLTVKLPSLSECAFAFGLAYLGTYLPVGKWIQKVFFDGKYYAQVWNLVLALVSSALAGLFSPS